MMQDAIIVIEKEAPQKPDEKDTRLRFSNAKAKDIFKSDDQEILGMPTTKDLLDMQIFFQKEKNDALASIQGTFSRDGNPFGDEEQMRTLCLKEIIKIGSEAYKTRYQLTYENQFHPHQGKLLYISKEELLFEEKECYLI